MSEHSLIADGKFDWELASTDAQACMSPDLLTELNYLNWLPAIVPGTVAQSMQQAKLWHVDERQNFDSQDWWYRTEFICPSNNDESQPVILCLVGLSTLCEIWLNGVLLQTTNNMFLEYQIDISEHIKGKNTLHLCFRSLSHILSQRQNRPKWKTKLVAQQSLRYQRTSLLGRIPGWTPDIAPVGPWREVYIAENLTPVNINITTSIKKTTGILNFSCEVLHENAQIQASIKMADTSLDLSISSQGGRLVLSGELEIEQVNLWWPHTHGEPYLYDVELTIREQNVDKCFSLPPIGFKHLALNQSDGDFKISVNGEAVFCRGACWTINDIVSLVGDPVALKQTLLLMRDAGANMIRIGGTMIYEQPLFYELCDELGIMIWQDFMFANMDYPVEEESFLTLVKAEAEQKIAALKKHACISLYCGNSEIEQQASMLGMEKNIWCNDFFGSVLPQLCNDLHSGIPYISSTPSGGVLPFHTNTGVTHYYGVGAYLCSVSELRQHNVKFTSECLGFSNIPISKMRNSILGGQIPVIHHPKWKQGVPRDTGTGWDFEDVRDHYLKDFYGVDPVACRSFEIEQYLALSENVTGEIMSQVFSEWRSQHSQCNGALVWFLKDLVPGAGWGIIDSQGQPKACYYHLKRVWQAVNILITDESLNGLHFHLVNESNECIEAELHMTLINAQGGVIKSVSSDVLLKPKSTQLKQSDEMLEGFYDVAYRYRFGPAKHVAVAVQLINAQVNAQGALLSECFYFVKPYTLRICNDVQLDVTAHELDNDTYQLDIVSNRFLHGVNIDVAGFVGDDNFFSLLADFPRSVTMRREDLKTNKFKGYVSALNMSDAVKIKRCKK